ncbi:hypothetical protein I545_3465 [Mycobacterium kansasii 662]|uniref:Uncharacterized protein n=1 Tax=Mycobacterium kansasii 662 TaxID=1299326 RepID=X7ZGA6_MYCKA|nr:hypothetical protein I545_3465 [Mycobacterium kansasii 662]
MTVGDFDSYLSHLLVGPAGKRIARWSRLRLLWAVFEGVVVDGLDARFGVVRCLREGGGRDSGRRGGDFAGYVAFDPEQLGDALADVGGECVGLGLTSRLFGRGSAGSAVDDREVFSHSKTRVMGVLDSKEDPALGGADGAGAVTGNLARLAQLVGFGAHDCEVRAGSRPQRITAGAFPHQGVGLVAHLQEHVFPLIGGLGPVAGRLDQMLGAPGPDLGKGRHSLHQSRSRGRHLGHSGRFVAGISRSTGLHRAGRRLCPGQQRRGGKLNRCVGTAHRRGGALKRLP